MPDLEQQNQLQHTRSRYLGTIDILCAKMDKLSLIDPQREELFAKLVQVQCNLAAMEGR